MFMYGRYNWNNEAIGNFHAQNNVIPTIVIHFRKQKQPSCDVIEIIIFQVIISCANLRKRIL